VFKPIGPILIEGRTATYDDDPLCVRLKPEGQIQRSSWLIRACNSGDTRSCGSLRDAQFHFVQSSGVEQHDHWSSRKKVFPFTQQKLKRPIGGRHDQVRLLLRELQLQQLRQSHCMSVGGKLCEIHVFGIELHAVSCPGSQLRPQCMIKAGKNPFLIVVERIEEQNSFRRIARVLRPA